MKRSNKLRVVLPVLGMCVLASVAQAQDPPAWGGEYTDIATQVLNVFKAILPVILVAALPILGVLLVIRAVKKHVKGAGKA